MKQIHQNIIVIVATFLMSLLYVSCDSSEPTYSQWDPDWDEHYERPTAIAARDYRFVFPTDVVWYGKRVELNDETKAMLKAESAEPFIHPLTVKTKDYGQLKTVIGSKALDIDELIVSGPINGDDLTYIKRCVAMGNLRSVDLSNAQILDNTIPEEAFLLYEYPKDDILCPAYLPLFRIKLPKGMEIGAFAFANSLLTVIEMPEVKHLGGRSFCDAFMLGGKINISSDMQLGAQCFMRAGNGDLVVNFDNKVMPDAFFSLAGLKDLKLAEGLEEIGDNAIYGVSKIEKLDLPSTLKKLGESSLQCNPKIKTLTLPASLESIGKYALANLKGLETLYVKFTDPYIAEGPRYLDDAPEYYDACYSDVWFTPFGYCQDRDTDNITPYSVKVYVPESALSEFKKSFVWGEWFWGNIIAE